jgi:hypothetical protein
MTKVNSSVIMAQRRTGVIPTDSKMGRKRRKSDSRQYDVCMSFAGENREYVEKVAQRLRRDGLRTFYDEYERASLWGKDLYEHLDDIYRNAARYCVLFISKHYAKRLWTNHERRSAQARAFRENREYILPARFDQTPLPGLLPTVGYVDLKNLTPPRLANLIEEKVGPSTREYYVPPFPDRLFARLGLKTPKAQYYASTEAEEFVEALQRMSITEKRLVAYTFLQGCPTDLPSNIHISADLLRRLSGLPVSRCVREIKNLSSLGFSTKLSKRKHSRDDLIIELSFEVRKVDYEGPEHATGTVSEMIDCLNEEYCRECTLEAVINGDFSALARTTKKPEKHSRS